MCYKVSIQYYKAFKSTDAFHTIVCQWKSIDYYYSNNPVSFDYLGQGLHKEVK